MSSNIIFKQSQEGFNSLIEAILWSDQKYHQILTSKKINFYNPIDIWEKIDERDMIRHVCFKNITTNKYYIQQSTLFRTKNSIRLDRDEDFLRCLNCDFIRTFQLFYEMEPRERHQLIFKQFLKGYDSLNKAILAWIRYWFNINYKSDIQELYTQSLSLYRPINMWGRDSENALTRSICFENISTHKYCEMHWYSHLTSQYRYPQKGKIPLEQDKHFLADLLADFSQTFEHFYAYDPISVSISGIYDSLEELFSN